MRASRGLVALAVVLACACSSKESDEATEAPRSPDETAEATPASADETEEPTRDPSPPEAATPELEGAPEEGCELGEPMLVFAGDAWVDVAAFERSFIVAGVSRTGSGEHAFAVGIVAGSPRQLARRALDDDVMAGHRRAPPALAIADRRGALAFVDGRRRLLITFFDAGRTTPLRFASVAESASLDFSPALVWSGAAIYAAWTVETSGGRRVFGRRVPDGGSMSDPVDVTPSSGGAAAPGFVAGASPPRLVFLDPREATSVALRVDVSSSGLGGTEVSRPISLVTDPPIMASVRMHGTDWLVYTGIGNIATTAVGFVPLVGAAAPAAVVEGTGYGTLHVDVDGFGDGAVIVSDAPQASPVGSPREVHLRIADASGALEPPVVIRGPRGTAARARVAAGPGGIAVAFIDEDGAYVVIGRCAAP